MRLNTVRTLLALLIVTVLVLVGCGPKAAPPATPPKGAPAPTPGAVTPAPTPTTPTPAAPAPTATVEKPKYGGTLNMLQATDITNFDAAKGSAALGTLINGFYVEMDWTKGPAGTGENDFLDAMLYPELQAGMAVESWKIPDIGTFIYNVRRGVRYGLNPQSEASRLMNGREFTADDLVYSINRDLGEPLSGVRTGAAATAKAASVEKTGPWEVTLKMPVDTWRGAFQLFWWGSAFYPPEVIQKYGHMNDWRNVVGVGPFMLTDFVPGSAATLVRHPNYWQKDPVGPGKGNQLPYVDTLKMLIIPDISTRLAALRTGKLDLATGVTAEDRKSVVGSTPRLKSSRERIPGPMVVGMRTDRPELPYKDKRVRQALMMATDLNSFVNELYGGEAVILSWPTSPMKSQEGAYWRMEELPAAVQDLYKYNPEKAKQLLAEVGYPNGFKSKIVVQNITTHIDAISAVKAMWAKVGVEIEVQPRETAVYTGITRTRSFDDMVFRSIPIDLNNIIYMSSIYGEDQWNASFVRDPKVEELSREMQKNIIINMPKVKQLFHDLVPYILDQAWLIPVPNPFTYNVWQPWMKNFHGEGFAIRWVKYYWIDQDLREQITGRR